MMRITNQGKRIMGNIMLPRTRMREVIESHTSATTTESNMKTKILSQTTISKSIRAKAKKSPIPTEKETPMKNKRMTKRTNRPESRSKEEDQQNMERIEMSLNQTRS